MTKPTPTTGVFNRTYKGWHIFSLRVRDAARILKRSNETCRVTHQPPIVTLGFSPVQLTSCTILNNQEVVASKKAP
jgi:hypothetical protein